MATTSIGIKKKKKKEDRGPGVGRAVREFATQTTGGIGPTGGNPSTYRVKAGYNLGEGQELYKGKTYESRGSALAIDDIPTAGHLAQGQVATYVKNLDANYGAYQWQGNVMQITGSGPAWTITNQGKV